MQLRLRKKPEEPVLPFSCTQTRLTDTAIHWLQIVGVLFWYLIKYFPPKLVLISQNICSGSEDFFLSLETSSHLISSLLKRFPDLYFFKLQFLEWVEILPACPTGWLAHPNRLAVIKYLLKSGSVLNHFFLMRLVS